MLVFIHCLPQSPKSQSFFQFRHWFCTFSSASASEKYLTYFSKRILFVISPPCAFQPLFVLILAPKSGKMAFLVTPVSCKFILFASLSVPGGWPSQPVLPRVLFTFWLLVGFSQWKDKRWKEKKNLWGYLFLLLSLCFDEFVAVAVSYSWCPLSLLGATLFPSLFHQSWLLILIPGYLSIPC